MGDKTVKKAIALILGFSMVLPLAACSTETVDTTESSIDTTEETFDYKYQKYANMTPEEIVAELTLEQKAAQMVQPITYILQDDKDGMKKNCYGSVYADEGMYTAEEWCELIDGYQREAIESDAGIPYLVGEDCVHGMAYCNGSVIFPHNIGQGSANDEELAYQVGLITADEAKKCHIIWNLYPCVAQSVDPRWGRTYETYSSDLDTITRLSTAYTRGLIDGGMIVCAKHFFGDGNVIYGTGEKSDYPRLIDRGETDLTPEEINALLNVYQAQIDAGVQTIMVSYTTLNGKKMHEQSEYIWKLKNEMGFEGFVVSDYQAIGNTSPATYEEQVISAINCGIDMLMEGKRYAEAKQIIVDAVNSGKITEDRINDAVTRIIKVKKEAGLFEDPMCEHLDIVQPETGSAEYRAVAEKLVEESLVLIKNEEDLLPLKEGMKVYVVGPSSNNERAQCGGWTMGWIGSREDKIDGVTTVREAFVKYAADYGIEVITDSERAGEADVVVLCVGEEAYAEWHGDTADLELCGSSGLGGNKRAIAEAEALGKPVVACIIAGRNVIINESDYEAWDSIVMCYLPGSEGKGITDVLCGCSNFTGKLPSPWYSSIDQIGTSDCLFERGYGLAYPDGFVPRTEPVSVYD